MKNCWNKLGDFIAWCTVVTYRQSPCLQPWQTTSVTTGSQLWAWSPFHRPTPFRELCTSWIWHLKWFATQGFICTKWGPKFVLNFECISGSYISRWKIVACLAGFGFFVSFSLSFLFCFSFSSKRTRQNTEFNRYFSVNRTVNYKFSTPPWSGISLSLFLLSKANLCMAQSPYVVSSRCKVVQDAMFWWVTRWHLLEAVGKLSQKAPF